MSTIGITRLALRAVKGKVEGGREVEGFLSPYRGGVSVDDAVEDYLLWLDVDGGVWNRRWVRSAVVTAAGVRRRVRVHRTRVHRPRATAEPGNT